MSNPDDVSSSISEIMVQLKAVRDFAYTYYSGEVQGLRNGKVISGSEAEHLLDNLLDFCGEDRFLSLFKDICQQLLSTHPALIRDYIQLYCTIYEGGNDDICDV